MDKVPTERRWSNYIVFTASSLVAFIATWDTLSLPQSAASYQAWLVLSQGRFKLLLDQLFDMLILALAEAC